MCRWNHALFRQEARWGCPAEVLPCSRWNAISTTSTVIFGLGLGVFEKSPILLLRGLAVAGGAEATAPFAAGVVRRRHSLQADNLSSESDSTLFPRPA